MRSERNERSHPSHCGQAPGRYCALIGHGQICKQTRWKAIMNLLVSLMAATVLAAPDAPPATATAFLSALASGDLPAARAGLSASVVIMDESSGTPASSSLEAFAEFVRACERTDLSWEIDAECSRRRR